jgi:cation:H+ antiporter
MSPGFALPLLALSLAVTLNAARTFARRVDRLGLAFGLPEALVGLLTALAADGPEISSALVALAKGDRGVSVGVVVGSNVFNLAAMIGLSALLTGAVTLRRGALALEGAMGAGATLLAAAVLLGWLSPPVGAILLGCLGVPYLLALLDGPHLVARSSLFDRPALAGARGALLAALSEHGQAPVRDEAEPVRAHHALWIVADVALIVAGSFGMVQAAVSLGGHWGVSSALIGVLVLGPLTSIPNAVTGVRLGRARRGSALVSEALNSNTINLAGGVMIPALFVGIGASATLGRVDLGWLVGSTAVCLLCLARRGGAGRGAGALLVALYVGFVAVQLAVH